jgi:hypothetical protein
VTAARLWCKTREDCSALEPIETVSCQCLSAPGSSKWACRKPWARIAAIRELLDRAYGKPTQFLAADSDVIPENPSAAELRAEIIAQFQQAFPEYRLLKVIPAENKLVSDVAKHLEADPARR